MAAGVLASACSSGSHRATPPTGPAGTRPAGAGAGTTSTTEAVPVFAPSPYSWTRAAGGPLALGGGRGATLSAVLAPQLTGDWTIVGTRFGVDGAPTATVWTSPDALHWRSSYLGAATTSGRTGTLAQASGAAQYHGATTVVGSVGRGANQQAAAWYSPATGAAYQAASVPLTSGSSSMAHVTVGALGTFATGTADGRFAMWSSSDGRHWNELPDAEKVITTQPGARVEALLAVGDSVYAAGSVRRGPSTEAALWASTDGLHWRMVTTAATAFSGPGDRVIYSLAPFETGLVAVGAVNLGSGWVPSSWISPDGLSWSPAATDFPGPTGPTGTPGAGGYGVAGGAAARSVAAVTTLAGSTALVATGGGPYGEGTWKSTDGLHWTALTMPGPAAAGGGWRPGLAAATTDTSVVVDSDAGRPYVLVDGPGGWSQPSSDPAVFGPVRPDARPVALDPSAATPGREQLVLQVDETSYPQTIGPPTTRTVMLTSADGRTWSTRAPAIPLLPPTLPAAGTLTIRVPGRWIAVGPVTSSHPAGWVSPTGTAWTAAGGLDRAATAAPDQPVAGTAQARTAASVAGLCAGIPAGAQGPSRPSVNAGPTATTRPSTTEPTSATGPPTTVETTGADRPRTDVPQASVAAVGSAPTPAPATRSEAVAALGRSPVAWVSTAGAGWHRATVSPAGPGGSTSGMAGCAATPSGLVAFGTAATPTGAPAPGLWRSTDGSAWTLATVSAFGADTPNPLVALAVNGSSWLAAADPDPTAVARAGRAETATGAVSGAVTGSGPPVGPATGIDTDALVGPDPGPAGDGSGLWLSSDSGSAWQLVDTGTAPWAGNRPASVMAVAFAGSRPVVAGMVDGQLAVWTGTTAPTAG